MSGPRSVIDRSTRCTIAVGVAERNLLAEPRAALVVVDRALDLGVHLGELPFRLQAAPLDAGDRVVPDDVVRVGPRRRRARSRRHVEPRRRAADAGTRDDRARAARAPRVNRPRADRRPGPRRVGDTRESSADEHDVDRRRCST